MPVLFLSKSYNMNYFFKNISKIFINKSLILSFLILFSINSFSQTKKDFLVTINTKFGTMHLVLFDKTPLHKANFLKLAQDKFYDGILFHRIIKNFMIQGGDPATKTKNQVETKVTENVSYKIKAEILPELFHTKGALAAARDGNPAKESSGSQFYIVQGKVWNEADLEGQIKRSGRPFTEAQKNTYKTTGGSPHLDGNYTVFGQLIGGFSVLDSLANVKTGAQDKPLEQVSMKVSVEKMRKKKIIKKYKDKSIAFSF